MTRAALLAALAALMAAPRPAAPCGAFYGDEVEVDPDQEIVVVHRAGVETYLFQPRFCGAATDFGVILPVPSTLTASPSLANAALFEELDRFTAPTIEEVCRPTGPACGSAGDEPGAAASDFGTGVDVVDKGQVGIFEWSLVQATSVAAFTDWLGANGFPYDPAVTSGYEHYVANAWYFVAFKVSADLAAPPEGMKLCGDLGPIQLSFASARPVVPARIASVNATSAYPKWRVFLVSATQQALPGSADFRGGLYFSGPLAAAAPTDYPVLAALAQDGERLTAIDVTFEEPVVSRDMGFVEELAPADFRSVTTRYKECGGIGCEAGGAPAGFAGAAAVLGLLRTARRRRTAALD